MPVPDALGRRASNAISASLHLEDLALAAACADGNEAAWDHFVREHRPVLYRAADAIDKTGAAREAADALYAELFGLTERDGERRSLFRYFHGRSSLATWLRAVLAQRYVDGLRRTRRLDPLPADEGADAQAAPTIARTTVATGARAVPRADAPGVDRRHHAARATRSAAARLLLCAKPDARPDRPYASRARGHHFAQPRADTAGHPRGRRAAVEAARDGRGRGRGMLRLGG